jgi:hypothetical protein
MQIDAQCLKDDCSILAFGAGLGSLEVAALKNFCARVAVISVRVRICLDVNCKYDVSDDSIIFASALGKILRNFETYYCNEGLSIYSFLRLTVLYLVLYCIYTSCVSCHASCATFVQYCQKLNSEWMHI